MRSVLQVLSLVLVAFAMAPALGHALELPGKMRLAKEPYFTVQRIYYPGFTIAGIAEPASLLSIITLLVVTPPGTVGFWLTVVALLGLLSMQVVYWILIHPVNRVWLQGDTLSSFGSGFFGFGRARIQTGARAPEWTDLRNRWEYAHVARAGFAIVSFIALVIVRS